jgi:hypothetical protein
VVEQLLLARDVAAFDVEVGHAGTLRGRLHLAGRGTVGDEVHAAARFFEQGIDRIERHGRSYSRTRRKLL